MSSGFKHNKRRNVGLIYELLVRKMGERMLENDRAGCEKVVKIIKQYYGKGVLAAEKEAFDTVCETRSASSSVAKKVLGEVARVAQGIPVVELEKRRTDLLHEINRKLGRDFFNEFRIPNYRLLASIQIYLDGCRQPARLSESVQRAQIEEGMEKWMTSTPSQSVVHEEDGEIDELVVKFAAQKFEEKYKGELSTDQKVLLESYSHAILTEDYDGIAAKMLDDKKKILKVMEEHLNSKEITSDAVTRERFNESYRRLQEMRVSQVNDENMEEMLLYWKLSAELSSNE